MPIDVTCPGCHKRFKVSDKFAGQKGPCPQCKTVMEIPKLEDQVVIHAPEHSGPTDAKGRAVLKTFKKKDAKFNAVLAASVGGVLLLLILAALFLRTWDTVPWPPLAVGAVLIGPLVAWAGYPLLRDAELEPYQGAELWGRATAAGLAFAAGWGAYCYAGYYFGGGDWPIESLSMVSMLMASAIAIAIGTLGAFAGLDLDPLSAGLLCGGYFALTILLRLVMGLNAVPGLTG